MRISWSIGLPEQVALVTGGNLGLLDLCRWTLGTVDAIGTRLRYLIRSGLSTRSPSSVVWNERSP